MLPELLVNPALPRALTVGAFGGVGLVLTVVYSRRGPMIFVPYAALLAALAVLLSRFGERLVQLEFRRDDSMRDLTLGSALRF